MRYLVHHTQASEIPGRQEYLYDIFHMYFLPRTEVGSYIPLIPVGKFDLDVVFITGHANYVMQYLNLYIGDIPETIIVATTCLSRQLMKFKRKKQIYVPMSKDDYCYIYDGRPFGFSFDISDPELDFYNSSGNFITRLQSSYRLL